MIIAKVKANVYLPDQLKAARDGNMCVCKILDRMREWDWNFDKPNPCPMHGMVVASKPMRHGYDS